MRYFIRNHSKHNEQICTLCGSVCVCSSAYLYEQRRNNGFGLIRKNAYIWTEKDKQANIPHSTALTQCTHKLDKKPHISSLSVRVLFILDFNMCKNYLILFNSFCHIVRLYIYAAFLCAPVYFGCYLCSFQTLLLPLHRQLFVCICAHKKNYICISIFIFMICCRCNSRE